MIFEQVKYDVNFNRPPVHVVRAEPLMRGDKAAQKLILTCMNNDKPYQFFNTERISVCVVRADGATVYINHDQEQIHVYQNEVQIILTPACYLVPGETQIFVRLLDGDAFSRVILWISCVVASTTTDIVADMTQRLPSIDEFSTILAQTQTYWRACEGLADDCERAFSGIQRYPYQQVEQWAQEAQAAAGASSLPALPSSGSYVLSGIDGVMSWQEGSGGGGGGGGGAGGAAQLMTDSIANEDGVANVWNGTGITVGTLNLKKGLAFFSGWMKRISGGSGSTAYNAGIFILAQGESPAWGTNSAVQRSTNLGDLASKPIVLSSYSMVVPADGVYNVIIAYASSANVNMAYRIDCTNLYTE